ncbi:SUF system Fe-S cluster assembly protein [Aureimonas phyllosphaerae]|uniref:FeS assembly SUF system protein n=1 Tax=Aureimonas phyllosphaerae TaxID=1166078 RepID=A0A7W6FTU7_9HYPH|nr:SUF system Fe-S cluster assembly protein [Aureimonas phyllosphaerae]MBB3935386.1 FeS assembly SUF system protein [Aureimonas phyllosphaerae]MBB3959394.1 FeS assembly SUF system protein [Aureimonas phyllosphaerae]SFF03648.1 FeS assembly SUF system protein [Aureimonas phyllosphaerae]
MADTHDTAAVPSPTPDEAERVGANLQTAGADKGSAIPPDELSRLTDDIVAALKTVYDPEIPADIYELGLIYKIDIDDDRNVDIDMTLTAPGCPVAGEMPGWVENAVGSVEGIQVVKVELVFDPPWTPERMSEEAQVAVGWF